MSYNKEEIYSALQSLGLTNYESRTYLSLLSLGISDARDLCIHSGVPSSKIYSIMNKFRMYGLIEVQQSKPARFRILEPSLGINKLMKYKEKEINSLKETLPFLNSELEEIYSASYANRDTSVDTTASTTFTEKTFFNLEFGMKNHIQKHLLRLTEAEHEICSYFESTCLSGARVYGHTIKQHIVRNIMLNDIQSKILFGVKDLKMIRAFIMDLPQSDKIEMKITKEIHAPFHIMDIKRSIMVIDNPLFKDRRVVSIYAMDKKLARELHEGYRSLWDSARDVKETIM
ncbi:hypothetical protein BH23THE1_BH23THE1_08880 [soil metagenome]